MSSKVQHWLISTEILTSLGGGTCTQKVVSPDGSVFYLPELFFLIFVGRQVRIQATNRF